MAMTAKNCASFTEAIEAARERLLYSSLPVRPRYWQGLDVSKFSGAAMLEMLNFSFSAPMKTTLEGLVEDIKPDLPWADDHFEERVSRIPHNPPPSHEWWPHGKQGNKEFMATEKFSHTYPERMWPKKAAYQESVRDYIPDILGIRYPYGDLDDVVNLLIKDPLTRQAYLPLWFPEDTGAVHGERVPCTLGYHFIARDGLLHVVYYIRSCDFIRHFRNDIYFTARLLRWVWQELRRKDPGTWDEVYLGHLTMHITSLHIFARDFAKLKGVSLK